MNVSHTAAAVTAWESLFRAQVSIMRVLSERFPDDELSMSEYDVLFTLSRQPDRQARVRELTRHVLLTQPSVSRLVDRVAARGLVSKCPDPSDGRGTIVELTPRGFEAFRRVAVEHMRVISETMGDALDPEELRTLTELTRRLHTRSLGSAAAAEPPPGTATDPELHADITPTQG